MARVEKIITKISQVLNVIGGTFLLIMMVLTVANVIVRVPFNSMRGITELVSYSFVVVIFFGFAYTAITRSNVEVDLFFSKLPPHVQTVVNVIINLLSLGIWIIIARQSISYGLEQWHLGEYAPVLDFKLAPFRLATTIGSIMLCVVLLFFFSKSVLRIIKR